MLLDLSDLVVSLVELPDVVAFALEVKMVEAEDNFEFLSSLDEVPGVGLFSLMIEPVEAEETLTDDPIEV